jgi:hypothetical protein
MKFQYLAAASTILVVTNSHVLPRQLVTGNTHLNCTGTTGAECGRAWWTLCSTEGNVVMPAPAEWKNGDCTAAHCNCINPDPVPTPTQPTPLPTASLKAVGKEDFHRLPVHTESRGGTPHPHTKTIVPATIETNSIAGSYIWK